MVSKLCWHIEFFWELCGLLLTHTLLWPCEFCSSLSYLLTPPHRKWGPAPKVLVSQRWLAFPSSHGQLYAIDSPLCSTCAVTASTVTSLKQMKTYSQPNNITVCSLRHKIMLTLPSVYFRDFLDTLLLFLYAIKWNSFIPCLRQKPWGSGLKDHLRKSMLKNCLLDFHHP